jgi:beta-glucosidase
MKLLFPSSFLFGTSTSAYQIETAFDHDWVGIKSRDGYTFNKTTDHEKKILEDVDIISSLAPNYRMSLMWSKLQRQPFGNFDPETVAEYHALLSSLKSRNVNIMMVLHHWVNPSWFVKSGGWENVKSVELFLDFTSRVVNEFGRYVSYWNTFNEPNLYAAFAYLVGEFPPYNKNVFKALTVVRNMSKAHDAVYSLMKSMDSRSIIGVSHNCISFHHENVFGMIISALGKSWYMNFPQRLFLPCDFIGISYYARLSFDPLPITYLNTPEKFAKSNRRHDKIWEYHPEGLEKIIRDNWRKFRKPIIITENGVCTDDDNLRIQSLREYMKIIHRLLEDGIDIRGYYHWAAWDNFEWTLGPTYKFGLYDCDPDTMERTKKPSADVFAKLAHHHEIFI